jgi:hypothetical protein
MVISQELASGWRVRLYPDNPLGLRCDIPYFARWLDAITRCVFYSPRDGRIHE